MATTARSRDGLQDGDHAVPPSKPPGITEHRLRQRYRLTEAEAAIAVLIGEGYPLTVVAALRRVSIFTVRAQLRSIYAKTGVTRQAALVRLVLEPDRSQ